jgi:DNA repair protein RadC
MAAMAGSGGRHFAPWLLRRKCRIFGALRVGAKIVMAPHMLCFDGLDVEDADVAERAVLEGVGSLPDDELLGLVLSPRGRGGLARRLLDHVGGLRGLVRAGPARLAEVKGVGQARALRLLASVELGRRLQQSASARRTVVRSADDVAALFRARLEGLDHEEMWVLSLDGRSQVRGCRCAARGGRHGLVVSAREILSLALADAASAFILVHNHPSGAPDASPEDVAMTQAVLRAAAVVGIPMLDHVIIGAGSASSMLEAGLLDTDSPDAPC